MDKHDLFHFFQEANHSIESEYERICASVSEDPGTAGDQGEENWKILLEQWLPPYFHIETKGRILFEDGTTSPQVDIVVLAPEYPKQLWKCKHYLSGGVVAAFECKTTLRKEHIHDLIQTSKIISDHTRQGGTPWKDLHSRICYGMLAHSHSWKQEKSKPIEYITETLWIEDYHNIEHPCQMPEIICVADLAVWKTAKLIIPKQPEPVDSKSDHDSIRTDYIVTSKEDESSLYTPVGAMIFDLLNRLAWVHTGLRDIVSYMRRLNVSGSGQGHLREWTWDELSFFTKRDMQRRGLSQGSFWDEWGMVQM